MTRTPITSLVAVTLVLVAGALAQGADPTPPIMPVVVETPLPPPVTLPAPASRPEDVPATPLTATAAARIALRHQPSITVAQMGVAASQGRVQQSKAGLATTLGVSSGYNRQAISGDTRDGSSNLSANATLKKLLYDANHTRDLVRQSTAQEAAAQANLTRAQSDLIFQVKQAYYSYVQAQRLVTVNEENLRNRQEHLAQAQARVRAGLGLPIDVVRAETAVADAILTLNLAQNTAAVAQVQLAQVMGLDPLTPIQTAEAEEPAPAGDDVTVLLQTALQQRPEIRQAQATVQASQYAISATRTANTPALVGSMGLGMQGSSMPPTSNAFSMGLSLQWNPFDGGLNAGRLVEAQANHDTAQAQLTATQLAVTTDVTQAYLNARTAAQRVVTAEAQVTNAQEAVRLAQGRYNAGLGIFLDVLDAQTALSTAQTNRVNAQSALNQSRAALAHALCSDPAMMPE